MRIIWLLLLPIALYAQSTMQVVITNVYDGDTLYGVTMASQAVSIRLAYIDAPELEQPDGTNAKIYLNSMVSNKTVILTNITTDPFGRYIATMNLNGTNINAVMVSNGYAWAYDIGLKNLNFMFALKAIQYQARIEKLGLWKNNNPVKPYDYRNKEYAKWQNNK